MGIAALAVAAVLGAAPIGPFALAGSHLVTTVDYTSPPTLSVDGVARWQPAPLPSHGAPVVDVIDHLAASPTTLAFSAPARASLFYGPLDGPFRSVRLDDSVRAVDVSGSDVLVTLPKRVLLLHGRTLRRIAAASRGVLEGGRIAGRFAAWQEVVGGRLPGLTVYDLTRHRVAYRIPLPDVPDVIAFDVAPDGTLVFQTSRQAPCAADLAWASPRSPRPHLLPIALASPTELRISGGRIVFSAYPRCDDRALAYGVTDLAGHARTIVADVDYPDWFDFDGRRIAYVQAGSLQVGRVH